MHPLVIAHRGASGHAPEHTFAAWDLALEMEADFIEQDLQMTADGTLVVLHDPTLERTTNGTGLVSELPVDAVTGVDAGSWFGPRFAGERVPTLRDVFARYKDRAAFYVETKHPETAPGMEAALLAEIRSAGLLEAAIDEWRVVVQSFSERSLRIMAELAPGVPLVRLLTAEDAATFTPAALAGIAEYAVGTGPAHRAIDLAWVESAHAAGLQVHPWTVNEAADLERMIDLGVDAIFTDYPDRLRARLREAGASEPTGPEAVRRLAIKLRRE